MKYYLVLFFVLAVWCAVLPCLQFLPDVGDAHAAEQSTFAEESVTEPQGTPCFSATETELVLYIVETNTAKRLALEEYVVAALAGVMAPDSPAEALKAQAVAIRSFALHRKEAPVHSGYDLCSDPVCCYPVGDGADERCIKAALLTEDKLLCYEGTPIMGLSHLSSCISTESWDEYPYLSCVKVEDESGFDCYKTTYKYTKADFAKRFSASGLVFEGEHGNWIGKTHFTAGNRVSEIELCGVNLDSKTFAAALGLDSLCFAVTVTKTGFDINCYGSGSGYGMSRCSAVLMAAQGADYTEILQRFYPNTTLCRLIC